MILLDTNVLIYAFEPGSPMRSWAVGVIRHALLGEGAAINPVILAEYLVGEQTPNTATKRIEALGILILDLPAATSPLCAQAYATYLKSRYKRKSSAAPKPPLPDFFIGAHASLLNLPLATADTSRYRTYFPEINLLTPDS